MSLDDHGVGPAEVDSVKNRDTVKPNPKRNNRHRSRNRKQHSKPRGDGSTGNDHQIPASHSNPNIPPNRAKRGVYSAIDLGTNNCRLLVAKPTYNGFRVIDAFSRIVRLGEGLATSKQLSSGAMDRTVEALKICADKIDRRNVTCMRHVATEACRVATNSDEFLERIHKETGLRLDIISPGEEARLAVMGCQSLIANGNKHALVFDIGGGSTELIWVKVLANQRTEIQGWTSIPWGVVNLTEKFSQGQASISKDTYQAMVQEVTKHLIPFERRYRISNVVKNQKVQFLGTSGTVTTLASLHLNLPRYIRDKVDGAWMQAPDIELLSKQVAMMSHEERSEQPCIGSERADLVVAGCTILNAILGMWNVPSLRVADRGIREGILRGLMQMERPPLRAKPRRYRKRRRQNNHVQWVE
ncbi:Ppx/GppA phosphatase family protein [Kordiimonas sp. SCSIO 12610]|uniref:Ppx/GppA phosphatase family protein n=1 Tax=Kordiimonas sp. SCSIO 12610 TaxID=2829597 RepID=UPI002109658D|nr:Ppx/GppA phosphatase family protein [Kordiimonas sp. SCSIO 12610]UTW53805.1 Ppx/GppA family phosphatase [Kordiimonas sp. SCSIO 12610]